MKRRSAEPIEYERSTQAFLDQLGSIEAVDPRVDGVAAFRASARDLQLTHTCAIPEGVATEEREIPGRNGSVRVRIYRNEGTTAPAPILIYLHGGGWVVGGLDECDGVCSYMCHYADVTVVSVDYRMAPEHKFPAAVEDSFDAVSWVVENAADLGGRCEELAVAGDSAGGNLAAVVCQLARDAGSPNISQQILIYPCLAPCDHTKHPSRLHFGKDDAFLSEAALDCMVELYRRVPNDETDWRFWPSLNENLADLPATYIVTAEYDMLRDEARTYGAAMSAAGTTVAYREYSGTIHGFFCFAGSIDPGRHALSDLCLYLKAAQNGEPCTLNV